MSEELRECPFCGGTHSINVINFITGDSFRKCDICGAEAPETKTPEEAAEKWNTRPAEDALKAEVERLKAEIKRIKMLIIFRRDWVLKTMIEHNAAQFIAECNTLNTLLEAINTNTGKGGEDE